MNVIEFLNMLSYRKDKMEMEKEAMDKWRNAN